MTRLPALNPAQLSPEQKELYDSIVAGPRSAKRPSLLDGEGHLTGPFNAFLHLPALGRLWSAIGEALRFRTMLDRRLFELAIVVIAVEWRCGHEWAAHAHLAREAGIDGSITDSLRRGKRPIFSKPDEEVVFNFVHELMTQRRAGEAAYKAMLSAVGEKQAVELVNAIGYYVGLAAMLNAFDVHPPKGLDDPWPNDPVNPRR